METPSENFISPAPRPTPIFQESPFSTKKKRIKIKFNLYKVTSTLCSLENSSFKDKTRTWAFMLMEQKSRRMKNLQNFSSPLEQCMRRDKRLMSRKGPVTEGRFVGRLASAQQRVQFISFRSRSDNFLDRVSSRYYDDTRTESYFEQCFEIECKIGQGSFGEVFRVRSKEDGRLYAVKKAMKRYGEPRDRLLKLNEVQKHKMLPKHVNLVNFVAAWEQRGRLYIQTELCDYSLSDYASQEHDIQEAILWRFFVDLLNAVKHLHDHDLVHLDIKPENIFISGGVCKLGDFGLVFDLKSGDRTTTEDGDSKYLAPEMLEHQISKAADIFSLGMSLLELACDLNVPSQGEKWHMLRRRELPFDMMKDLSLDFRRLVEMMLDPEPEHRPSVDQLLSEPAIRRHVRNRTSHLYSPHMLQEGVDRYSRHVSNGSEKKVSVGGERATPHNFHTPLVGRSALIPDFDDPFDQPLRRRLLDDFSFSNDEEVGSIIPKFQVSPHGNNSECARSAIHEKDHSCGRGAGKAVSRRKFQGSIAMELM